MSAFQRKFVNEVRRCDEMDRKLSKCCKQLLVSCGCGVMWVWYHVGVAQGLPLIMLSE